MNQPNIVVLGSLNMDLVLRVAHAPVAGETLSGHSMASIPGGKGGNQAVSCARQGARVRMIGCVGDDANGHALAAALARDGIDTSALRCSADLPTGVAVVMVDDDGQNRIVVIAGANAALEVDASIAQMLQGAAFLVTQFETPPVQVARAIRAARRGACRVMLNASPVVPFDDALWPLVDTLVVNEIEARMLSGQPADTPPQAAAAARALGARAIPRVVVTLGAGGAVAFDADGTWHHPAPVVPVVDTTAAGDTLLGALAAALADGATFHDAVSLGIRAASLCVTRLGAQSSIPARSEVLQSAPAAAPVEI